MKKISILALHFGYGGIEKSVAALANMLVDDYEVEIACSYKLYDEPAFFVNSKVKINYLLNEKPNRQEFRDALKNKKIVKCVKEGFRGVRTLYLRRREMINYIRNCDADVIISTRDIFNELLGEYGKTGVLKIGWEHNHYHGNMKYAMKVIKSVSKLDYFVLVSNSLKDFYSEETRKYKCRCVYIPNVIENVPEKLASLSSKEIVSVGRLSAEKGFIDLLKVFNLLCRKHDDWKLNIIGDGKEKDELLKYIKNHNLDKKVILHGYQNKEYIDNILNKSSIYVMTSYTESFGIVLIEAMSHGLPCIAFDSAEGARELIDSGRNGFLIKNRNFSAMIKKIEDLMANKNKRIKIGREGRKDVSKYTSDNVKYMWIDLIEEK